VASITLDQLQELIRDLTVHGAHFETRDAYGTETELPHMAKWRAGEPDDYAWMESYANTVRRHVAAGRSLRRAKIVSEPLSEYQRWAYAISPYLVDAGEQNGWVPRSRVSEIAIPGNDFWLFDDRLVVFLHYSGDGLNTDLTTSTDPDVITLCRTAFEEVWKVSTPHHDYRPPNP
jgi:hypothetical protein